MAGRILSDHQPSEPPTTVRRLAGCDVLPLSVATALVFLSAGATMNPNAIIDVLGSRQFGFGPSVEVETPIYRGSYKDFPSDVTD